MPGLGLLREPGATVVVAGGGVFTEVLAEVLPPLEVAPGVNVAPGLGLLSESVKTLALVVGGAFVEALAELLPPLTVAPGTKIV